MLLVYEVFPGRVSYRRRNGRRRACAWAERFRSRVFLAACGLTGACGGDGARVPPPLDVIDSGFGYGYVDPTLGDSDGDVEAGNAGSGGEDARADDEGASAGPRPDQDDVASSGTSEVVEIPDEPDNEPRECLGGAGPGVVARLSRGEYRRTARAILDDPSIDEGAFIPVADVEGFVGAPELVTSASELDDYLASADRLATATLASSWVEGIDLEDRGAVAQFVRTFGARVYRRPLTDAEIDRLMTVYDAGSEAETGALGAAWMLSGLFSSPHFIYRIELGDEAQAVGGLVPLTAYERASRLSYLFMGRPPDDALVAAAIAGELNDPEVLKTHARRLAEAGEAARISEFFGEWSGVLASDAGLLARLQRIDSTRPDIATITADSTAAFVERIIFEQEGSFADLLTTPGIMLNAALASAVGIAGDFEDTFTFVPSDERPGILSQPGIMAVRSSDTFAASTIRGHFVLEHIFCQAVPLPDGNEFSLFPEIEQPLATDRDTLEVLHAQASPACRGCHTFIDPYGFPFENYDRQGRYRTHQELIPGQPTEVDASGEVITREGRYTYEDLAGFASIVAGSRSAHACLSDQILRFALRRPLVATDECSAATVAELSLSGMSVVDTFVEIVGTESFLFVQPSEAEI